MRIDRVELVVTIAKDKAAVLTFGSAFKRLADVLKAQVTLVSVPDAAPPELPRLMLHSQDRLLQLGLNRLQLSFAPPSHVRRSYSEVMEYLVRSIDELVFPILEESGIKESVWSGLVAEFSYPQPNAVSSLGAVHSLFSRFTQLAWSSTELSGFQLRIGRSCQGFFRNYTLEGYELVEALSSTDGSLHVDHGSMNVKGANEVGVTIVVDVNSKPRSHAELTRSDVASVIEQHAAAVSGLETDLQLRGLLT